MIFLFIFLLFVKHWIADFVLQSEYQVQQKGIYGAGGGIEHAAIHGILTMVVLFCFLDSILPCIVFGLIDSVVHYHVDYVKARWGTKDPNTARFWRELGADQLAHATFYIWLGWILQSVID
jgi:hypothetical protein